ncbi:plasmid mobilization protein [uncultured Adlercreutzia sp.]|uniref:plasmid mobilization protein n=1 Tax=uncultured Adlercreutzia sp. TaxID=875803 RepID=UPI002588963F|nr:CopG family transcriptional regulator [uncultured Adlercreutzia sp.]
MTDTNKTHTLSFRLAEDDYQKLAERCRKAELSQSKYLRYLIRIPIVTNQEHGEDVQCIVLDQKSLRKMSRELTRWGYHYNQAVHAMNSINYYVAHGKASSNILDGKAESIEMALVDVNDNAQRIVYELAQLQSKQLVEE